MRDPDRIDRILAAVGAYWRADPDLRLGQILDCAAEEAGISELLDTIDDEDLARGLARFAVLMDASEATRLAMAAAIGFVDELGVAELVRGPTWQPPERWDLN